MRRRAAPKRKIIPDSKYESELVAKFMNQLMVDGKKSIAESIVYGAFEQLEKDNKDEDLVDVFRKSDECLELAKETIKIKAKVFWMQIGIFNSDANELILKNNLGYQYKSYSDIELRDVDYTDLGLY